MRLLFKIILMFLMISTPVFTVLIVVKTIQDAESNSVSSEDETPTSSN